MFGEKYTTAFIKGMVQKTNAYYGGLNLGNNVTNILLLHGALDPWIVAGRRSDLNKDSPSITVDGKITHILQTC